MNYMKNQFINSNQLKYGVIQGQPRFYTACKLQE